MLVTCKFDENQVKSEGDSVEPCFFSHFKSMGVLKCHGNTVLMESAPTPESGISPIPLHIKFDQDWPTCLGDSVISLLKI